MESMQLPEAFVEKMKGLLKDEWEQFVYCYENEKYQALRFNPLKKGLTEENYAQILDELAESDDSENPAETEEPAETAGMINEPAMRSDLKTENAKTENAKTENAKTENAKTENARVPWAEHAFYYDSFMRPGKHPYHEAGLYYIQEPSAMSAAAMLAPKPGMRVLDLCAAPGGKTTQLAAYLKQEGLLVANEIHPARCKILSQNVERMGICNAIVTNEDSKKLAEHFPLYFHGILVDAPCSGEGMFRKNPEVMNEWSPDQVLACAERQQEILRNAAEMLMAGGLLVYSTCTFSPEENEQTVARFLMEHEEFELAEREAPWFLHGRPEWAVCPNGDQGKKELEITEPKNVNLQEGELQKTLRLWPQHLHGEGHFVAVLKKKGTPPEDWAQENQKDFEGLSSVPEIEETERAEENKRIKGSDRTESFDRAERTGRTERIGKSGNRKNPMGGKRKKESALDKEKQAALAEFTESTLPREITEWIFAGTLTLFGDQLYRLPVNAPSIKGLKVLRAGLHIGEFKKNRFEPSHALALALGIGDARCCINLTLKDSRTNAYFAGESLTIQESDFTPETRIQKGWTLVCINGFSAGWGKLANGQLKNHYPKGLRRVL